MAADDGYHPPQFSEEAAWLPPWLRSSQLLLSLDGRKKDDQHLHRMGCEFLDYCQENMGDGQSTDDITKEDSRCFSCHLFLSGGDSSSVLGVHSSGNVPPFHLHLSAEGISQISSGGLGNAHTVGAFKLNREIVPVPELSVFQHEVDYERNTRNRDHPANISAGGGPPPIWGNQGNGKKNKEKVDRHLKTIDINDAVELTIAASEALVISELTTRVSHPEFFNTTALLEVALRVKQARKDCHGDVLEAVSSNLTDEHDETDQLHDLDDNIMADAFEDVGLLCNQIVATPNDSSDGHVSTTKSQTYSCNSEQGHSPYANDIYVDTHLSEDHGHIVAQENGPRTQDFDVTATALPEKLNHASIVGPKLKQLPFQACSVNHVEPSIHFLLNLDTMDTSNIKDQMRESIKSFQKNGDASTSAENLPKEDRNVQDHGDKKLRGGLPNLFHGETSFISESMDVPTNGNIIVRTPEPEPKIIASSSSLFENLHRIPWDENKINTDEDIVASCDLLEDILCSVVPCSLSDNDHGFHCPNQEGIGTEARWCLKSTTKLIGGQNTEECLPIMVDAQGGNFVASKIRDKGSMMTHKQLSSLKNYSVAAPAKSTFSSGKNFLLREPIPTVSTNENQCHSASREETARILMEPTTETQDINEKRESWENHGKACRPSAAAESISASMEQILKRKEAPSNDVNPMVNHHADISAPIILNTGARRRFQACKTISPRKDEVWSPKISFLSEMEKSRTRNPSDEVQCRNKACVGAACSPCLSSRTHSLEEQYLPRKKVRFSEAQADVHYLPANLSQEQSSPTKNVASSEVGADIHCNNATHKINCGYQSIHVKTNRKTKDSSKSSTFRTRKSSYKCLTKDLSKDGKSRMLEGLEFLLTGFSRKKKGEVETLIRRHGGLVLPEIPLPYLSLDHTDRHLPIVLSPKKVQTTKFLYGCAIKTWLLHNNWLSDSVQAGFMLPPAKYLTLPNQISERKHLRIGQLHVCNSGSLFDKLGVMLFGKMSFCTKFSKIIKLGGGRVFKALHWLVKSLKNERNTVGAIVFEDEINVSRHFKHCAMEHDLYMMPASWITNSLFSGKLLPCKKDRTAPFHRIKKPTFPQPDPVDGCEGT